MGQNRLQTYETASCCFDEATCALNITYILKGGRGNYKKMSDILARQKIVLYISIVRIKSALTILSFVFMMSLVVADDGIPIVTAPGCYTNKVCVGVQCTGSTACNQTWGYREEFFPCGQGCAQASPGSGATCDQYNRVCKITYGYGWGVNCDTTPGLVTHHYTNGC